MFGVLAEDESDFLTLRCLIRSIAGDEKMVVKGRGFNGCGLLIKDGAKSLRVLSNMAGMRGLVVCHDADASTPDESARKVRERVVACSGVHNACIIVPVRTIESWILADVNACGRVFASWDKQREISNPENFDDPKRRLERICYVGSKPRYNHATHNPRVAPHLNIQEIYKKCPSFRPLALLVDEQTGKQRSRNFWTEN